MHMSMWTGGGDVVNTTTCLACHVSLLAGSELTVNGGSVHCTISAFCPVYVSVRVARVLGSA